MEEVFMKHLQRRPYFYLLASLFGLFLLSGCGFQGDSRHLADSQVQNTNVSIPTQPTPILTPPTAILGGQVSAFIQKFGMPDNHSNPASGIYAFQRYKDSNLDYLLIQSNTNGNKQTDSPVYRISVSAPPHTPWDATSAEATCALFLPIDARYLSQELDIDGQGHILSISLLYSSASLESVFPSTQADTKGLLHVQYTFANGNRQMITGCVLKTGAK
jgi:hypothetical protein